MMTKRKERTLKELYDLTDKLLEPEITPVLKGSCRIQGPVDESEHDLQENSEASPSEKDYSKGSLHENVSMRAESGTCNVCSTPCSSCMHFNRAVSVMESKVVDEFSEQICKEKERNQCSYNDSELLPLFKSRACDDRQHTATETSNLLSASSSHDSFSENAESKASMRAFETSDVSEDVEMLPKLSSGGNIGEDQPLGMPCNVATRGALLSSHKPIPSDLLQRTSFRKYQEWRGSECHGDNISCVTGIKDANIAVNNHNIRLSTEDIKADQVRSNYSFEAPMKVYPCLDTENEVNSENPPSKSMKCSDINQKFEKPIVMFEEPDMQEPSLRSQPISESHSGSDVLEDDIKVCDICGDAGREEMLAICSRCSDGAEHTYCMKIMLDKVPEGDWLCEGCKLQEDAESQQPHKIETISTTPTAPASNEGSQENGGTFNLKGPSKLDTKTQEAEENRAVEVIATPQVSAKRHADNLEIAPLSKKCATQTIAGSPGVDSPNKKSELSKESSFKNLYAGRMKPAARPVTSSGSHSANNSQITPSLGTSSPNSSRMLAHLQSPRGILSRSATLNSLNTKHNLKQLSEDVSERKKLSRESASKDARKEGLVRMISKSTSFKDTGSGHLNATESKAKTPCVEDPRSLKPVKEQNLIERKNSFKSDRSLVSSSPKAATTSMLFLKADMKKMSRDPKAWRHDVKSNTSSDPTIFVANKGPEIAIVSDGYGEAKKQSSCLSSGSRSPCISALKGSAEKSSREMTSKSRKWKDAIEATISRTKVHKNDILPYKSDHLSNSSTDLGSEAASKVPLSNSSSCVRNFPSLEGAFNRQETVRSSTADSGRATVQPTETICEAKETNLNVIPPISDGSNLKSYMRKMPSQAPLHANPLRISAIPEHNYIWQGGFEVQRRGRLPDLCDGIQAHLSTCASPKVHEVVNKFPYKVQLEEVPRLSSWPLHFKGSCATEDSISLYFFAKDLQSYERKYKKLLENMLKNDLALKGNFDGIELLIFPSNQLSEKSQRWNRLFFLWAIFRGRENCLEPLSGSRKEVCGFNLGVEPSVHDLPTPVMTEGTVPQKTSHEHVDNELSTCDASPRALEAVKLSASLHLPSPSSYKSVDENVHLKASSISQSSIGFHKQNQSAVEEILYSEKRTSCLSPEILPEVKCKSTMKEVFTDSDCRKDTEVRPSDEATNVQSGLNKGKGVPIYLDRQAGSTSSSLVRQDSSNLLPASSSSLVEEAGPQYSRDRKKMRDQDKAGIMDNDTLNRNMWNGLVNKENSSCELMSSRKHPHSDCSKTISEEFSKKTSQTIVFREKTDRIAVEGEKECKKIKKCDIESSAGTNSQEQSSGYGFSPKIFDLDRSPLEDQKKDCVCDDTLLPESSGTTERFFFPVDSGPVRDCKSGNSIPMQIISSDDEDQPESDFPNLELALGAEKKSTKKGVLPFFLEFIDEKNSKNKLPPDPVKDDGDDDVSASLSLSLAFPFSEKERIVKPVSKTKQFFPEGHHVNTSLLLFGGFPDNHR
ncbi:ASI1-immunoprecipitated protein 2-like isoform X2 [Tasmannia lanceolata]|uniref:ASI1-immunoprecipitated protein 2-like isoform X2 n=1 Tax=Tasmannia lanceolata TaxID=3420 RepID=UPI0040638712